MDNLTHIRNSLESFNEEISKEYYLNGAGIKPVLNLEDIYKKYPLLFSDESILTVKNALNENTDLNEKYRLKILLEAVYGETIAQKVKSLKEVITQKESTGKLETSGGNISFMSCYSAICNNESAKFREEISNKRLEFINDNINPLLVKIFTEEEEMINSMGYENKIQMFGEFSDINLHKLNLEFQSLLSETDNIYDELLGFYKNKKHLKLKGNLRKHDLLFLMRGSEFDSMFTAENMLSVISNFTANLGISSEGRSNIKFDLEKRELKSPRAFCSPVRIPSEIYLVVNPHGGLNDYSAFMHELGHALHFGHINSSLEMEYKWFGDNSVTEGFAMTFDHLLFNKKWLLSYIHDNHNSIEEYLAFMNLKELAMLRRYAAKLEYELALNDGKGLKGKEDIYAETFERATKIKYDREEFLYDVDPYFYCARYLRAWMFQAALSSVLEEKYGDEWFLKKEAGDFLKELWSYGQKYSAEELLYKFGSKKLSQDYLLNRLKNLRN